MSCSLILVLPFLWFAGLGYCESVRLAICSLGMEEKPLVSQVAHAHVFCRLYFLYLVGVGHIQPPNRPVTSLIRFRAGRLALPYVAERGNVSFGRSGHLKAVERKYVRAGYRQRSIFAANRPY